MMKNTVNKKAAPSLPFSDDADVAQCETIIDEACDESFPASDPPAWTGTIVK